MKHIISGFLLKSNNRNDERFESFFGPIISNGIAIFVVILLFEFVVWNANSFTTPVTNIEYQTIYLDYYHIMIYALKSTFRMFLALILSLLFGVLYGLIASKSRKMEQLMIPLLDILQSVPILGYISFTVTYFVALAPNTVFGLEMVAIFAIFTSQVWNIALGMYQGLKSIPCELFEIAKMLKLNSWQRFWKIELPFCTPNVIWNLTISMAGGWFFVVASEMITIGSNVIKLPGIGSAIATALIQENMKMLIFSIFAMSVTIFIYNFIIFNPLIGWSEKFKFENSKSDRYEKNIVLHILHNSVLFYYLHYVVSGICSVLYKIVSHIFNLFKSDVTICDSSNVKSGIQGNYFWYFGLSIILLLVCYSTIKFIHTYIGFNVVMNVFGMTIVTFARIMICIILFSIFLVPLGVLIGLSPRVSVVVQPVIQFLASFPANILFPIAVIYINRYHLDPTIWLSPLILIGSQWYILYNVISGATQIPVELRESYQLMKIKGILWWKKICIPAILPNYITGLVVASGGAWNASILAEAISWGDERLYAYGVGSYITKATIAGDHFSIFIGIIVMACTIVVINKILWEPLYHFVIKKYSY